MKYAKWVALAALLVGAAGAFAHPVGGSMGGLDILVVDRYKPTVR